MWLTPNDCDNMRSSSACTNGCTSGGSTTCIADGDNYLKSLVPKILNSNTFQTQRSALFITFDEGSGWCPLTQSTLEDCVWNTWTGPAAKNSFTTTNLHNHYSFTKTIEVNWNLASLTTNDANAIPMTEFLKPLGPDFTISSNPVSPAIQSGSSGTSTITLSSIGGFSGTVSLSSSVSLLGLTATLSPSSVTLSSGGSATSTLAVSSSTPGSYAVVVNGIGGSLSHPTTVTVGVGDFTISSNPASLWMQSGSSPTSFIQLTSLNSFSGTVSLSAAVSPYGLTASLNPTSVSLASGRSGNSTLTLSSSSPGNYTVTITGTSGFVSHSAKVIVTGVSSLVASDSAAGPSSIFSSGGEKLIQDSAGKMIAVYVDSSGRMALAYDNSNPMAATWSVPVKSLTPASSYVWPAAVLVSPTFLRIIAGGGSGSGVISDIPVTIARDSQNNITGFTFGTSTPLDSSGLGRYPAAVLAHNGDILLAWAWQNSTRTMVKSLRWDGSTGWTNFAGSSSVPDIVLLDSSSITWFLPNIVERPDNNNVYLLANRLSGPPSTLAYNKASWNGSSWSWGAQNLTYETNSSTGVEDPVSFAWDPVTSLMVVSYGITGTQSFGVFTLNLLDQKTHLDTPSLAITERDWGTVSVHITTGDYYLFLMNVDTDGGSGTLGYIRHPAGGTWNSTIVLLDAATNNQGLSLKATGTSPTLDLLYATRTASPAIIKFVRLSPLNPSNFSVSPSPPSVTVQAGSSGTSTVTLTSLYSFAGTINLSTTVSPSGLTASLSPTSLTLTSGGTAASTLTLSSPKPGTYAVTVQGNGGSLSHSVTVTVTVIDVGPTVSFTESATTVPTGTGITLTISASDLDGTVSSLKVVWGDGTIDSLAGTATSDSHSYALAGSYAVYVNATDNANLTTKSSTATKTITDRPPTVSFTESATTAPTGTSILLTISASDPDGTVTSLKVVWGDGTIDSLAGVATSDSHTYSVTGSYQVYVNATDNSGSTTKSAVATKTITDRPPTVSFAESATTVSTGTSITLTITARDPDGTVTSLKVSWGDGTVDTMAGSATSDSHAYSSTGNAPWATFTVYVNATDNSGSITKSSTTTKAVNDRPPMVSFTESTTTATTGQTITLAILSGDPDGTISTTVVNWGDGTVDTFSGPQSSDGHAYSGTGNASTAIFTLTVTVTDNGGNMAVATSVKTVQDRPPIAAFTFTPNTLTPVEGQPISFDGAFSSDPDGLIMSYQWNFGDGIFALVPQASHAYSQNGNYTVTLTVTDNSGSTGIAMTTVKVRLDVVPPGWPSKELLSIYGIHPSNNATSLGLSWAPPASDDGAIALYKIYINGVLNATVSGSTTTYIVNGLKPGSYTFEIEAVDYGGLASTGGPKASITVTQGSGSSGSRFAT